MVYHGPREEIIPFFEQQGMHCPERKADSDFLQEVTSRKDQKVLTLPACCTGHPSACTGYVYMHVNMLCMHAGHRRYKACSRGPGHVVQGMPCMRHSMLCFVKWLRQHSLSS